MLLAIVQWLGLQTLVAGCALLRIDCLPQKLDCWILNMIPLYVHMILFFHGAIVEPCCTTVVPMFVFGIVSICQYSISLYFYVFAMPRADVCWRVACCEAMGAASKDWQIAVGLFQAMADGQGSVGEPIVELITGDYRIFFVITYCSLFFPLIGYKNHIEIEWNWCY